jgi:hypothetical protein
MELARGQVKENARILRVAGVPVSFFKRLLNSPAILAGCNAINKNDNSPAGLLAERGLSSPLG